MPGEAPPDTLELLEALKVEWQEYRLEAAGLLPPRHWHPTRISIE